MHFLKNSIFIHFLQDYGLLGYSSRKDKRNNTQGRGGKTLEILYSSYLE